MKHGRCVGDAADKLELLQLSGRAHSATAPETSASSQTKRGRRKVPSDINDKLYCKVEARPWPEAELDLGSYESRLMKQ